jgi:prolyl-tRNA synthetase
MTNVNYPRDFQGTLVGDVAQVRSGDLNVESGEPLELQAGIEIGNTFKLGTFYSEKLDANYLAADGSQHPIVMGSYGIGIGRLAASVVERYHDDDGIIWPPSIAPYDVHVVQLGDGAVATGAEILAGELEAVGLSVLLDDRSESAGVKFNDADLIGIPLRLTVSKRTLAAEAVEFKVRTDKNAENIPRDQVVATIEKAHADGIATLTPDAPIPMPSLG